MNLWRTSHGPGSVPAATLLLSLSCLSVTHFSLLASRNHLSFQVKVPHVSSPGWMGRSLEFQTTAISGWINRSKRHQVLSSLPLLILCANLRQPCPLRDGGSIFSCCLWSGEHVCLREDLLVQFAGAFVFCLFLDIKYAAEKWYSLTLARPYLVFISPIFSNLEKPQLYRATGLKGGWWLYLWKEAGQGSMKSYQGLIYPPPTEHLKTQTPNHSFPLASYIGKRRNQ